MARTGLGSVAELQEQPTTMRHGETYLTSRAEKWPFYGGQLGRLLFLKNHTPRVVFKGHMPE